LTEKDLKHPTKAAARMLTRGDDFLKLPQEVAIEGDLLMAELKALGLAQAIQNAK
jgi:hypothetical protein